MTDTANAIWTRPVPAEWKPGPGRSDDDRTEWEHLVEQLRPLATQNNWTKAEVARRAGVSEGTFSQWYSGTYSGRYDTTNEKMRQFLGAMAEMSAIAAGIPTSPGYVETRISREIVETLLYAQQLGDMSIVTIGAGMGKTFTARHYCATRPHAYLATMSPYTKTPHGMLMELAAALGVTQNNPARLHRTIGAKLQRNGKQCLLIVDEAQNLIDAAVDQLRSLVDQHECGVVLMGNEELYGRYSNRADGKGPSYAQIKRRIGKRLRKMQPYPEDIAALIDAWGIEDEASRKLLTGIANKPGALGQVDKTLKLAALLSAGSGRQGGITEKAIRAAWTNRAVED